MQVSRLLSALSVLSAVSLGAVLTGCGDGADAAAPASAVLAPQSAPVATAAKGAAETSAKARGSAPDMRALPNVIGMSLQEGQNAMQAAGFFVLDDQDATGQNRFQVNDHNWVITDQSPAAGRKFPTDTPVVLYAKKYGE
ncbi:PASTA domain-containing protein [Streptosporangium lutulentum]|uniref:PASTA domain-containing protein n=1 Tax=Streptosporangium lutulentum TaxID=1461250 RepID=A0ABT9Q6H3_9ACTN|nr:PASTA domain-containing protein [Streptosporangium lutulentum]MDP9842336.1 hypothetical protein [Streptosporangium lutulentum]